MPGQLTIGDGRAMTSHFTGIPLDDLGGFVIIGISDSGAMELRTSTDSAVALISVLASAVQLVCDGAQPGPGDPG